ncbi:hypothetical protein HYH02_009666 [Chlamydomonas schloesseri]|uniref:Peptidase M11 gametolysin domain-containing protein n=1 Tax=Chlamydomonas schloesseri TaxID=2026947 RepID=A0A835TBM8_9CHLO|nr:hypothetical protein HYH02_009666 [Chlamydomonas schloesseri]|eukprot:KAG2442178.1 hypothetical protein HYH02_009666 [Chlamydomonas schloesseri]
MFAIAATGMGRSVRRASPGGVSSAILSGQAATFEGLLPLAAARSFEGRLVTFSHMGHGGGGDAPGLPGTREWALINPQTNALVHKFARGFVPPARDRNQLTISAGAQVAMSCASTDPTTGLCTAVSSSDTYLISGPTPPAASARKVETILLMRLDFSSCGYKPTALTDTDIKTMYLGPNMDGNGGHAQAFEDCSYGALRLNASAFTVKTIVVSGCTAVCDFYGITGQSDTAAKAQLGYDIYAVYTNIVYLLPDNYYSLCSSYSGMATIPGNQVILHSAPNYTGIYNRMTVLQESLHNFLAWHSYQFDLVYQDPSTCMAQTPVCPSAADVRGEALNTTSLPPGAVRSFNLPASYLTGTGSFIKIKTDWTSFYNDPTYGKNVYVSVRAVINNAFPTDTSDPYLNYLMVVAPNTTGTATDYNLVVIAGNWPIASFTEASGATQPASATLSSAFPLAAASKPAATQPTASQSTASSQVGARG